MAKNLITCFSRGRSPYRNVSSIMLLIRLVISFNMGSRQTRLDSYCPECPISWRTGQKSIQRWVTFTGWVCSLWSLCWPTLETVGGDFLSSFSVPGLWADSDVELIAKIGICVVARAGINHNQVVENHRILKEHAENIVIIDDVIQNELSSTAIRKQVVLGDSVKYLTPDSVLEYMISEKLYSEESQRKNCDTVLAPLRKT